ncbi:MAG: NAD-dependent epimerase/dehydratase family protein [Lachnospiraceae bacterium]|nr:NAD-dependent epimerase/dehydratase family protein [Lachnospiraceae bacterium]
MKILVIGGSYFYGRVFVMQTAQQQDITLVNRGTYSMADMGVTQIRGDRRDPAVWRGLSGGYDVVVDFCAYEPGDIRCVLDNMPIKPGQYIAVSTVDVYRRGMGGYKTEDAPFEERQLPGEAGAYIAGKVALEKELRQVCEEQGVAWTVLRPGILYGPYNYAPRESAYIQMMVQQQILPRITDADGQFQLVYVKDGVEAIQRCLCNSQTYGKAYNICMGEPTTYGGLADMLLRVCDRPVRELPMTVEQAERQGIPLPFAVRQQETELYDNAKSLRELGMVYTSLEEGMGKTYRAFRNVYQI